jgi:hypothetical protein
MGFILAADRFSLEAIVAMETVSAPLDTMAFWRPFRTLARKDQ